MGGEPIERGPWAGREDTDGTPPREHRGWHTPRKLPHFDSAAMTQAITFRLADSLPKHVLGARCGEDGSAYRRRLEAALDAGAGACWLRRPEIARIVVAALWHRDGVGYDLHAYVVMPNHVHVLVTQHQGHRLADTVQAWKSFTAKAINRVLGRTGTVWQREYFDRFMRDETHFERTRGYIEANPVAAGFVAAKEDWPFSSAAGGSERARLVRDGGGGGETPPLPP